ncbi:putative pentatricopeptide repeat-containing protein At1g02420 [Ananas comosus]|uniref:Pentatricopeptide repeat-containing protein At1g02420 n=1 Tax=Ananas comosus TaxID=4615 RepID=A0A6P5FZC6_ANACO|nr:putative pentatricopeptide repeat-containing protein At1g02420 [Ananas comosus]
MLPRCSPVMYPKRYFLPETLTLTLRRRFSPNPNPSGDPVAALLRIVTTSSSPESMESSLESSRIPLSPDLLDSVLKKVRFCHANPLKTLDFFRLAAKQRGLSPTPFSYDTMLYVLGRSRRFGESWALLKEMKRQDPALITPRTVMVVLGRVAKVCSVRQTLESFRKLRKLCAELDTPCFNALLRTLSQEKTMGDARNAYHSLKHDFKPNLSTFNILLSGWRSAEDAEGFFAEMRELGVRPDLVSYNCLVDVYCKNRDVAKAYKVLDEMREREMRPDVITYTSLIGGLGLVGQPDKARDVLREMRELGCYPDVAAYNAAIRNYCIAKRLGDAFALMEEMRGRGLEPNATSYNLFFRCFYWANDLVSARRVYEKMRAEACLPNTQSCMFLIRLCRRQEKVDLALELWNDMVEKGFGSFTLVSDVLFDLLCDAGKLEEAERCFHQMVEKGQKPSNVSFKRIKVLMELANRHESISRLSEKMALFGRSVVGDDSCDVTSSSDPGVMAV